MISSFQKGLYRNLQAKTDLCFSSILFTCTEIKLVTPLSPCDYDDTPIYAAKKKEEDKDAAPLFKV